MQVICLEDEAFHTLLEKAVERILEKQSIKEDRWISGEEAMRMLRISSKTTLLERRNNGDIRYSQPEKKIILYDKESILEYLEKNVKNKF